jgi:hypothetical protein
VANANRASGAAPFKPSDFMPEFDRPDQTPEEMQARLAAALRIGGA